MSVYSFFLKNNRSIYSVICAFWWKYHRTPHHHHCHQHQHQLKSHKQGFISNIWMRGTFSSSQSTRFFPRTQSTNPPIPTWISLLGNIDAKDAGNIKASLTYARNEPPSPLLYHLPQKSIPRNCLQQYVNDSSYAKRLKGEFMREFNHFERCLCCCSGYHRRGTREHGKWT